METTVTRESLDKALEEAKVKLAAAEADAAEKAPGFMNPLNLAALAALNAPIESAKRAVTSAEKAIDDFTRTSRWDGFLAQREPMQAVLNSLIKAKPVAPVASVKGRVVIETVEEQEGDATVQRRVATVTLTPVVSKIDLDVWAQRIEEGIDVAAWDEAKISDVTISIADLSKADSLTISPTASLNAAGKSTGGEARSGAMEYSFNGQWLGTRAFLEAVEASGHAIATERKRGFDVSLREPSERTTKPADGQKDPPRGNGMSTFGGVVAKALGVESRAKPKAE